MACDSPIDCNNKDITPEEALKKLIQVDVNGCPALNTFEVAAAGVETCDPFITCDNKDSESWKSTFFKMITTDTNGCWALRIIKST